MFSDLKKKLTSVIKDGITITETLSSTSTHTNIPQQMSTSTNKLNIISNQKTHSSTATTDGVGDTLDSTTEIPSIPKYKFVNSVIPVQLKPDIIPSYINLNAGSLYLSYQEHNWRDLHERNEENSNTASEIDKQISNIQKSSIKTVTDLSDLTVSLCSISGILRTLNVCGELTKTLAMDFRKVADSLTELEDLCEQLKYQEYQKARKLEITKYKEKKMVELDVARQQLVNTHANNVRQHEYQITVVQKERQAVFQDAFQQDLNLYKQTGIIPKPIRPSNQELTLEEIILDNREDTKELDNFLNKC